MRNCQIKNCLKFSSCLILALVLILSTCTSVFAAEPYAGYNYNWYSERVASPNGYLPTASISGHDLGISHFLKPSDVFVDAHNDVYIADAGNNRIVILNENLELETVIDQFTLNGEPSPLDNPQGVYATSDGEVYIADTDNHRVLRANRDGSIIQVYEKPESDMVSATLTFEPHKVVVNANGDIYVLAKNVVEGAMVILEDGTFFGYFGAEQIQMDAEKMGMRVWRKFMTEEQIKNMMSFVPIEYTNLSLKGDFVYTATSYQGATTDQIRKLNPNNTNLFAGHSFGDLTANYDRITGQIQNAAFIDVKEDDEEFVFCLDKNAGKIYMYSQRLDFLFAFGGTGTNLGEFENPISLEAVGNKVLVLDDTKSSITVFEPTYFGEKVREATILFEHGKYEAALEPWREVQKLNSNYEMSYIGIGRAYLMMEEYEQAIENFRLGYSKTGYSDAKKELRTEFLKQNFSLILTLIVVVCIGLWLLSKQKTKIRKMLHFKTLAETGYAGMAKWKYPFYIMMHPNDGFQEMKNNKKGSLPIAIVIFVLWYISAIFIRQNEDFAFNPVNPDKINVLVIAAGTMGIFLIACFANWAICTLMDGKGTFVQIFTAASYSLLPTIIVTFLVTFISKVMVQEEAIFIQVLIWISYAWTALMILMGTQIVHDFTFKKAISMLLLTFLGMIIILFLILLIYTLFNQVVSFVRTIYSEILYRFFAAN